MYTIIDKYYSDNPELRQILISHSEAVASFALECCDRHPELPLDRQFIREAALLHDIGIFLTHAPSIHCHGYLPYIAHGLAGELLLLRENLPLHARVAARHTGAGLTAEEILLQGLPLPPIDLLPETPEEKLICYADKFFSKSPSSAPDNSLFPNQTILHPKPIEKVRAQMLAHGPSTAARFESLHSLFS